MMSTLFRKVRGLLGVGLTWGGLWSAIGAGVGLVIAVIAPDAWRPGNPVLDWAIGMGLYGTLSGVAFGGLLALLERRGDLFRISLRRATLWGIAGAAMVPPLFGALGMFQVGTTTADILAAILMTASLGGMLAPASIAVARRAELAAPEEARLIPPS